MSIKLTLEMRGLGGVTNFLRTTEVRVNTGVVRFAQEVRDMFHDTIKRSIRRRGSKGTLASSIRVEVIKVSPTYLIAGCGNMDVMTEEAPYWHVVNYGATFSGKPYAPPATMGSFEGGPPVKGHGGQDQRWGKHSPGFFMQNPKQIRPLRYIQKTQVLALKRWRGILKNII